MCCTLALLCDTPVDLGRHAGLLEELGVAPQDESGRAIDPRPLPLLIAAPEIEPLVVQGTAALGRAVQLVASLHPRAGLLGALQSALLAARSTTILAIDAAQSPPPAALVRALLRDPRPANALACRPVAARSPALPGRFRRTCLGPISRALLDGERALGPMLHRLRCSSLVLGNR